MNAALLVTLATSLTATVTFSPIDILLTAGILACAVAIVACLRKRRPNEAPPIYLTTLITIATIVALACILLLFFRLFAGQAGA